MLVAIEAQGERVRLVNARDRADAEWRQELLLVQHVAQHTLQPIARRNGEEPAWSIVR